MFTSFGTNNIVAGEECLRWVGAGPIAALGFA
jgi:hypothetical protein